MKTISLFLLLTLGTIEQSYGPYARPERGGKHSLATARGNVLLAWSEKNETGHARVHVVLLDASGRAISPIRVLPALTPSRDALVPAVGTDGVSFFVVWEEVLGMQQTVGMALGPDGEPLGAPQRLGADVPILSNNYESARVHWTGDAWAVLTGTKNAIGVGPDGSLLGPLPAAVAAVTANGTVGRVSATRSAVPSGFGRPGNGTSTSFFYLVSWSAGSRGGSTQLPLNVELSTPYMTAAGEQFLIVFATNQTIHYRLTSETQTRYLSVDVDPFAHPRAACNATHCIVTYANRRNDVEGFVLDHTRPELAPMRFIAAATADVEREPEVSMTTKSRALLTWRSTRADGGEHLVGRTLQLGPTKQRTVR